MGLCRGQRGVTLAASRAMRRRVRPPCTPSSRRDSALRSDPPLMYSVTIAGGRTCRHTPPGALMSPCLWSPSCAQYRRGCGRLLEIQSGHSKAPVISRLQGVDAAPCRRPAGWGPPSARRRCRRSRRPPCSLGPAPPHHTRTPRSGAAGCAHTQRDHDKKKQETKTPRGYHCNNPIVASGRSR